MKLFPYLFTRGIKRISHRKFLSRNQPITPLAPVQTVFIPLGKCALPAAKVGQRVARGELIARASGAMGVNAHASVAGVVSAIESESESPYIAIQADGSEKTVYLPPLKNPTAAQIVERVREAGIVGMGGAGFPTHLKLTPNRPIDTLILNGAECEPYLTCDDRLMQEQAQKIIRGAQYLGKAVGAKEIVIGIERNKPAAIAAFQNAPFPTVLLKKQYPMGSEKHLAYAVKGKIVPLGKYPSAVGALAQNVATAFAVCEAVEEGKPLVERVVTLSGEGISQPKNLLCPIGAQFSALVEAGGGEADAVKIIEGGPMTGKALLSLDGAVKKTTSGILLLCKRETNLENPTPCINCGRCANVCPMRLLPMQTEFYTAIKDYANADKYGGVLSCIECGACSYICPARRPLAQAIRAAKERLREVKEKI